MSRREAKMDVTLKAAGHKCVRWLRRVVRRAILVSVSTHETKAVSRARGSPLLGRLSNRSRVHQTIAIRPCRPSPDELRLRCLTSSGVRLCGERARDSRRTAYALKKSYAHVHSITVLSWRHAQSVNDESDGKLGTASVSSHARSH